MNIWTMGLKNSWLKIPGLKCPSTNKERWYFNPRLYNHEIFNPKVQKLMVKKSEVEKFIVVKSGIEKSGAEMSFNTSSYTDLDNARFWVGSKRFWDARIYVAKTLGWTVFWCSCLCLISSKSSYTNFELHKFSILLKTCISRPYCIF